MPNTNLLAVLFTAVAFKAHLTSIAGIQADSLSSLLVDHLPKVIRTDIIPDDSCAAGSVIRGQRFHVDLAFLGGIGLRGVLPA